jgi:hypothetical protein
MVQPVPTPGGRPGQNLVIDNVVDPFQCRYKWAKEQKIFAAYEGVVNSFSDDGIKFGWLYNVTW